jgi:hypothetical protein
MAVCGVSETNVTIWQRGQNYAQPTANFLESKMMEQLAD